MRVSPSVTCVTKEYRLVTEVTVGDSEVSPSGCRLHKGLNPVVTEVTAYRGYPPTKIHHHTLMNTREVFQRNKDLVFSVDISAGLQPYGEPYA